MPNVQRFKIEIINYLLFSGLKGVPQLKYD